MKLDIYVSLRLACTRLSVRGQTRDRIGSGGCLNVFVWMCTLAIVAAGMCSEATAQSELRLLLDGAPAGAGEARPNFNGAGLSEQRAAMVDDQIKVRGVSDAKVLAAMRRVPRHLFVPTDLEHRAYADTPLAIGHGQTISQPYIVGYMTEMLGLGDDDRVLEIGTGSAYQAAILAEIVSEVVSVEIIEPLAASAADRLGRLGYRNVTVLHGDGYYGYETVAPYDAVIVTAAASHVPPPLVRQLKPGGRIVIPVGEGWTQNLLLVEKDQQGGTSTRNLIAVRFVPLTGGH